MAINLFQSSTNNIFNPFANNNNPIPTQNNFRPQVPGSYRGSFQSQRITYGPTDGDDLYTTNIFMQREYKGISALQIRLEDYYLIRSQQIQDHHKSQIEVASRKNTFNPKLIRFTNQQNLKPPLFQDSSDIFNRPNNLFQQSNDLFRQTNNNQNIFSNPSNNQRTDLFSNNQNDFFNRNNNPSNIFNAPPSNNLFNSNNNSQMNIFQKSSNNTNNIFQQNNNNKPFNNQGNNNSNLFNQSTNIFNQQQNNNNIFNSQNLFSNNNNLFNSNNLFNQPQQSIFNQPIFFQYPVNNNFVQPIGQTSLLGTLDYLKFHENQFNDFSKQVDSQIIIMEQQKQQSYVEYDSMLRDSVKMNFDYRLQNEYTKTIKSNKLSKFQIQKSSTLNNKSISTRQDKGSASSYNTNSSSAETKNIFQRDDRKSISNFQDNNQNTLSKSDIKNEIQKEDRKYQQTLQLYIEIKFLESDQSLQFYQEFQNKSKVYNVKQFVENHLQNIQVFGQQEQQYFNNCIIYQDIEDINYIVNTSKALAQSKSTINKLIFHYFQVKMPKLIRDGYQSNLSEFYNYYNVTNFKVSNKFGEIVWTQPTNLYYIDLDKIIDIKKESIEVYDTTKIHELLKPNIGNKLNNECLITFKFELKNPQINESKFEANLKFQAQKQGLELKFIDFKSCKYQVKALHFSGYHFNSDYSNTDNYNFQDQQQQVEIQTNNDEISSEIEENDSLSLENQSEFALQLKQKFDHSYQNLKNQEKIINFQQSNETINKFNQQLSQKIVIPLNFVQKNQQMPIDINLLQNYFSSCLKSEQIRNSQSISILLLDSLYQCKNPTEEIIRSVQLFNILFGNPTIDIVNFLQLQSNNMISLQDVNKTPKIKNIRGLRLSIFLEQFKIYFNQVEYREQLIFQQQKQSSLLNVFLSLNLKPNTFGKIKINQNDWIDRFAEWRVNKCQPQPLYEKEWWNELYNQQKDYQIASSQFASFIYYLLKKTKQPLKEYKQIYEYIHNNLDTYTIILFNIMLNKQKVLPEQLKLIGRAIISKLLKMQVPKQLILNILETFKDKVFKKEELVRVKQLLGKIGFFNNLNGKDINDIDGYIDKKQFIKATKIIIDKRLENQYYSILTETILPYLIICDHYNENELGNMILVLMNLNKNNDVMVQICQMYLRQKNINEQLINEWITKNEYQYHLKQIMIKVYLDQF